MNNFEQYVVNLFSSEDTTVVILDRDRWYVPPGYESKQDRFWPYNILDVLAATVSTVDVKHYQLAGYPLRSNSETDILDTASATMRCFSFIEKDLLTETIARIGKKQFQELVRFNQWELHKPVKIDGSTWIPLEISEYKPEYEDLRDYFTDVWDSFFGISLYDLQNLFGIRGLTLDDIPYSTYHTRPTP